MITPLLKIEKQVSEYMEQTLLPTDEAELHVHIKNVIHDCGMIPQVEEILQMLARRGIRSSEARIRKALQVMGWNTTEES